MTTGPTVALTERVPAPAAGRFPLALTGGVLTAHAVLVVAAFVPLTWLVGPLALVVAGLEAGLVLRAPFSAWLLSRLAAGAPVRGLVQGIALLVLFARTDTPVAWSIWAAGGLVVVHLLRLVGSALVETNVRQRRMPMLVRNLNLDLTVPPAPPAWLGTDVLAWPSYILTAAAGFAVLAESRTLLLVGVAVAALLVASGVGVLGRAVWAMRALPRPVYDAAARRALEAAAPEVALYHAGGPETGYQVVEWLEPLETAEVPAVVVLRDRELFTELGPTRLPVVCVEHSSVLMGLPLPALRLALYPAHAAGNLNLLRRQGVRHAFVGHGDSDKPVTTNPFLKAYDEIWVAGPEARERFARAGLGLDPERVVEVGRPSLRLPAGRRSGGLTVLYAPTWEGYEDEPHQSSVGPLGIEAVRRLVAEPDVRVRYRPHPLTGSRDPAVRRADREIRALLGDPEVPSPRGPGGAARDELSRSVESIRSRAEFVAEREEWAAARLDEAEGHLVVPGPAFPLAACFAEADVLLADVSSVVSEFLVTERPYAVTNPGGRSGADFAVRYPSSRGGYLVGAGGAGLADLLRAGRGGQDPAASERRQLRARLLGAPEPSARERFRREIRRVP